ncbi:crosslink repair DNA glycosylase YcaQ family protein [Phytomonospora sp. NPDC050363]|uniref:winged helix-turn-helix domain-containing protein n=1 Tax=Phytomonospora sp. NPDC050363 TaxID=3155642 RepID=UPI0033D39CC5
MRKTTISNAEARRIALAAQGFGEPRPSAVPTVRHLRKVLARTNALQIDSINVLVRAHYMPVFSRLGPYATQLVDRAAYEGKRELFEYWGHAASLLPVRLQPLLRWRMAAADEAAWGAMKNVNRDHRDFVRRVKEVVAEHGPLPARGIEAVLAQEDASLLVRRKDNWGWNWGAVKAALEYLFWTGEVTTAARPNFERSYGLTEHVLPPEIIATPTPPIDVAHRELMALSAESLGVATEGDLRDYFRLKPQAAREAIAALVEEGTIIPVQVEGWAKPAYVHAEAKVPRAVRAAALVSPFDPLVWERDRTLRLWDFHYRIEIYVPEAKRKHGYYVLPFLLDEMLAARVDLKADRRESVLRVPSAWREPHVTEADAGRVAAELAEELRRMARWLGLEKVEAPARGDFARELSAAL